MHLMPRQYWQSVAISAPQHTAAHVSTLQHVAAFCSVMQRVAVCCSALQRYTTHAFDAEAVRSHLCTHKRGKNKRKEKKRKEKKRKEKKRKEKKGSGLCTAMLKKGVVRLSQCCGNTGKKSSQTNSFFLHFFSAPEFWRWWHDHSTSRGPLLPLPKLKKENTGGLIFVYGSVLQWCCSVLQCVAVWYVSFPLLLPKLKHEQKGRCEIRARQRVKCVLQCVLQCVAVCCSVLQCVAVCCSVLQCVAVCCSVLQCVAVCCGVVHFVVSCFCRI